MNLTQAKVLWAKSIQLFNTTSYVYKLQKYCGDCHECDLEPKYILIKENIISNVTYVDSTTECLQIMPIQGYQYWQYRTIYTWFNRLDFNNNATYNSKYGYPQSFIEDSYSYDILCVSFLRDEKILNSMDINHCDKHSQNQQEQRYEDNIDQLSFNSTTDCEKLVIEKDDCTEYYYIYMTTGLSVVLSVLSIICFWLYYRQGINPATRGYKRSQSYDNVNENDDSDTDQELNDEIRRKKRERKKKMSKLLGIDENKEVKRIKIRKNIKGKYGSVAQTDEDDEKFDNPFDMDDSERSDEWHFVSDNKNIKNGQNAGNNGNQYGASSASDQTDEEEED